MKSSCSPQITKRTCEEKTSHRLGPCKNQGGSLLHHEKMQLEQEKADVTGAFHTHLTLTLTTTLLAPHAAAWQPGALPCPGNLWLQAATCSLSGFTSHSFRAKQPLIQDKYGMTDELHTFAHILFVKTCE